jgi:ubiquinone/menaquinone biosynthesis C-methylase UbiE
MERHTTSGPWGLGDYHAFATAMVWGFGPELVEACNIVPGQRALDVATGSGNVALRAAEAGADVVALDITPENLAAGRAEAERRGLSIDWVEGDAQALPFADASFDVVTSSVGAIFAPDHQATANELLRVCRRGGTIGMINFTPEGLAAEFFALFGGPTPPPPVLWGDEDHLHTLFGDRITHLQSKRGMLVERHAGGPEGYVDFYKRTFGPIVAAYDAAEDPAALDARFLDFARRANQGSPAEYHYEYLLVTARRSGSSGDELVPDVAGA